MKTGTVVVVGAIALLIFSAFKGSVSSSIDLSGVSNSPDVLNRLQNLYNAFYRAGLSDLQIKFCLSQILLETGMTTDQANYTAMDIRNNYAGLTTTSGGYAHYDSIDDFVDDYIRFLTKGSNPLDASDIDDFNSRLVANHYYTDSPVTYGNNLRIYFNRLTQ